jgi:hypothetical protein
MRALAILFILTLISLSAFTQENIHTLRSSQDISLVEGTISTVFKPVTVPDNIGRKRIANAGLIITLAVEDGELDNFLGELTGGEQLSVTLAITDNNTGNSFNIFLNNSYTLSLSSNKYNSTIQKDFTKKLDWLVKSDYNLASFDISVTAISGVSNVADILPFISCYAEYYITYGYDVKIKESGSSISPPVGQKVTLVGGRTADFSWDHYFPFSAYELQILHFPKYDKGVGESVITNWSQALKILVPVEATTADNKVTATKYLKSFRLINGTGIYVWRVRAIGGYNKGGLGDNENFGYWSGTFSPSAYIAEDKENTYWFYFEDPEGDVNTIRSRVYTEDLKVKEINTYADGLQNIKQLHVNIPSNQTTIITQTEQDFTGRNSLTSIPVPLGYETDGYEDEVLINEDGERYTAKDFDDSENGGKTPVVIESGALSYYNNNANKRIANTEGYPFSRTTYYNDGLNRIKEQSAPGSTFANNGSGHLIRYYYGTASEKELVRVFGAEAPNPQNVSKTVVVDQNNVATITYKTLDGNVIATCLSFAGDQTSGLLPVDNLPENSAYTTQETVNNNIKTDYGFYSSKRLVISQATKVQISYILSSNDIKAICSEVYGRCKFSVEIEVVDLANETVVFNISNTELTENSPVLEETDVLPAGSYLIKKKLYTVSTGVDDENLRKDISAQIKTLYDIAQFWLTKAQCNGRGNNYYECMKLMRDLAESNTLDDLNNQLISKGLSDFAFVGADITDWTRFTQLYNQNGFPKDIYEVSFYKVDDNGELIFLNNQNDISLSNPPDYAHITTGSCCDLHFPAKYIETFDFSKPATINPDGTVYPDFESYAKEFFGEGCLANDPYNTGKSIYHYMDGWEEGTFNLMIYHMLTDEYDRTNRIIEQQKAEDEAQNPINPSDPQVDECGNPIDESCAGGNCYTMYDLFNCWRGVLEALKQDLGCSDMEIEYGLDDEEEGKGIVSLIDEENNGDESIHDDHYDDNFKMRGIIGWIAKRRAKKKISKAMRDDNPVPQVEEVESASEGSTRHLVKDFLECSGYQFAKILTGFDPKPLEGDIDAGTNYVDYESDIIPGINYPVTSQGISSIYYLNNKKTSNHDYNYIPISDFNPKNKIKDEDGKIVYSDVSLFPEIKNPIYAFKYFVYNGHGKPYYASFEKTTCFDDPNDAFMRDDIGNPVYNTNGIVEYVPSCISYPVGSYDPDEADYYSFCAKDYNYPLLNEASTDDYRFGSDAEGKFRYVVKDFDAKGRFRCPYTHKEWSSGQRMVFYKSMLIYTWDESETIEEDEFIETCTNILPTEAIPLWYQNGNGEIIRQETFNLLTEAERAEFSEINYSNYYYPGTETYIVNGTSVARTGSISRLELEMGKLLNSCTSACSEKREDVKTMVYKVLTQSGYNIGGCISDETPENIPEEDVEVIIDELIAKCEDQCVLTTFACENAGAYRDSYASRWVPGPNRDDKQYAKIYLGVSTTDDAVCDLPELSPYSDCNGSVPRTAYKFLPGGQGPSVDRLDVNTDNIGSLSWFEYTLLNQATEWSLNMSIEPTQDSNEEREFECSGESTTFVDKNQYEVPPAIVDETNPGDTDVDVKSPANALNITINGQQ